MYYIDPHKLYTVLEIQREYLLPSFTRANAPMSTHYIKSLIKTGSLKYDESKKSLNNKVFGKISGKQLIDFRAKAVEFLLSNRPKISIKQEILDNL